MDGEVFIASDHRGFEAKNKLVAELNGRYSVSDLGPFEYNPDDDYNDAAIAVAEEMSHAYRENLVGRQLEVLFEEKDGEYFTGHAMNYVKVYCEGENLHNEIKTVTVTEVWKDGVKGMQSAE